LMVATATAMHPSDGKVTSTFENCIKLLEDYRPHFKIFGENLLILLHTAGMQRPGSIESC
jgi:hypothetical protein